MRPHLSERLADLRADLVQNPASEAEFNLLELVYLDALRAHIQGLTNARLSHLHSAQAEAMAAAEAVWQSQTALLAEQRRAAEAGRAAAALALSAATFSAETEPETPALIPAPVSFAPAAEEFAFEPEVAPEPIDTQEPTQAPEPTVAPTPTAAATSESDADDTLWAYAKAAAHAAKNVLAGFPDGELREAPAAPAATPEHEPAATHEPAPSLEETAEPEPIAAPAPAAELAPSEPPAAPAEASTVASKAALGQTKGRSLNARFANFSLGLNDRLAFSKHLFNDNPEDLARVVNQLNTYETYEDSVAFIEEMIKPDYDWSAKQDYEERLRNLIKLRFE